MLPSRTLLHCLALLGLASHFAQSAPERTCILEEHSKAPSLLQRAAPVASNLLQSVGNGVIADDTGTADFFHGSPKSLDDLLRLPPKSLGNLGSPPKVDASGLTLSCSSRVLAVASGLVALLSEMCFAAMGFGPAVMYEIFWELFKVAGIGSGELEEAVWNSLVMSVVVALIQAMWLSKHMNFRVVSLMTLPLIVGLPMGTILLEAYGKQQWMKRCLGAFFLAMVCIQLRGGVDVRPKIEDLTFRTSAWTILAAFIGGLSRGLFGVSAPVSILLLFFSLDKDLWRFVNAIYRISIFAIQGPMLWQHLRPQPACAPMYTFLIIGGLAGMVCGNAVAPHVSVESLRRWLTCFLAAAALLMIGSGFRNLQLAAAFLSVIVIFLALLASARQAMPKQLSLQVEARKAEAKKGEEEEVDEKIEGVAGILPPEPEVEEKASKTAA